MADRRRTSQGMRQRKRTKPIQLKRATFRGRGLRPELRGANWEQIRELAYEGTNGS